MLESVLILEFGSAPGTDNVARLGSTFGPLTLKDLDAFPSNESRFGRFAGDLLMISTRRGPPVSGSSSVIDVGCGIMLDLRRILSLRNGPTFERLRVPFVEDTPCRGVDAGRRREGLSPCSPFLGICRAEASSSFLAE